jgi:competence protein ComGC
MDILFYSNTVAFVAKYKVPLSSKPEIPQSYTLLTVHIVLIGISMVVLAFLPLYKKAINKINTKKVLEENVLNEEIDTSAEV